MSSIIRVAHLHKSYPLPKGVLTVFEDLSFSLERGELVAVMGVSGVGKTTLLNLVGGLDHPSGGEILIDGEDLLVKDERQMAEIRNRKIGFVFQFYHLLPEFTVQENVAFPLLIAGLRRKDALERASCLLKDVSLQDKAAFWPRQLSGGEQQRVAIARALVNRPLILLADEPTGNLDWKTGEMVLRLIRNLHRERGLSSVMVTHNEKVAEFCDKTYVMEDGRLKLFSRI